PMPSISIWSLSPTICGPQRAGRHEGSTREHQYASACGRVAGSRQPTKAEIPKILFEDCIGRQRGLISQKPRFSGVRIMQYVDMALSKLGATDRLGLNLMRLAIAVVFL